MPVSYANVCRESEAASAASLLIGLARGVVCRDRVILLHQIADLVQAHISATVWQRETQSELAL